LLKDDEDRGRIEAALLKVARQIDRRGRERIAAELEVAETNLRSEVKARKRAVGALAASEQSYRLLFESIPHPMWVYDVETLVFLAANDAAVAKYGYSSEEFLSMTIADIAPANEDSVVISTGAGTSPDDVPTPVFRRHQRRDSSLI